MISYDGAKYPDAKPLFCSRHTKEKSLKSAVIMFFVIYVWLDSDITLRGVLCVR